jgi:hypothetical protein
VDQVLNDAVQGSKNVITSSLLQCYQEEQDFLSMKRSIMSLRDKGLSNKYTRDITRISFHQHAKDNEDLCEMIQSNLQSSLIDALIIVKVGRFSIVKIACDNRKVIVNLSYLLEH